MGEFDIQYNKTLPGVVSQPRASLNVSNGEAAIGNAVANAGSDLFQLTREQQAAELRRTEKEYEYKVYGEVENGKIAVMEFDAETDKSLQSMTDPDQIQKYTSQRLESRGNLYSKFATTPDSQKDLDFYTRKTAVNEGQKYEQVRFSRQQDRAYIGFDSMYNQMAKEGGFPAMPLKVQDAFDRGVITEKEYARRMEEIPRLQHDFNFERVRELSQAEVTASNDKKKGYEVIQKFQDFGILTAEDNKKLGDSLDNFWEGRYRKGVQAQYSNTLQSYGELTKQMQSGTLTYDAIYNSPMLKPDKEKWAGYIKKQYAEPPRATKLDGQKVAINAVFSANSLALSEQEAMDDLLKARYEDESITDTDLAWALDKIKNPYPKEMVTEINAVLKDSENEIKGLYHSAASREKTTRVNSGLIAWIDKQRKDGKEPSQEDMYAKARTLQYGVSTSYMIGDTIKGKDKTYVVTGYWPDGEPAVEEVK